MQKQGYKLLSNFLNTMIGKVTYNGSRLGEVGEKYAKSLDLKTKLTNINRILVKH